MPKQAPGPLTLIHSREIMKLKNFTDLNERRVSTIPEKMTISITTTTELAKAELTTHGNWVSFVVSCACPGDLTSAGLTT